MTDCGASLQNTDLGESLWERKRTCAKRYEYNYQPCNLCGRLSIDPHHCLVGRKRGEPWRDHWYNIEWLCRDCHDKYANADEHRRWFFQQRVEQYGEDFLKWWRDAPMKVPPHYE